MMSIAPLAIILAGISIVSAQVPDDQRSYRCESSNNILFVPLDLNNVAVWSTVHIHRDLAKQRCLARGMMLPRGNVKLDTLCILQYAKRLETSTGVIHPTVLLDADQCSSSTSPTSVYSTSNQTTLHNKDAQFSTRYFCLMPVFRCPPMTAPENGYLSFDNDRLRSSNVRVYCNPGYRPLGKFIFRCLANALWELGKPFCEQEPRMGCPALEQPSNGIVVFSKGLTPGSQAIYTCDPGYYLNGNKVLTCNAITEGFNWNALVPSCLPLERCPGLIKPRYATMDVTTEVGIPRKATFSCHSGYNLTGSSSISCEMDGIWSAPTPTCSP